jgi:LPS export ABC transporter permease LptG/LPS export ABC transporter permease LptF
MNLSGGLIGRRAVRDIHSAALLATVLFTFVLFLQRVSRLFEQLVRGSAEPETIGRLFLYLLPPVLVFTVPVGVLAGTIIALSRMSGDSEIVAMRATGMSSRRLLTPVLFFGLLATALTGAMSCWLSPLAIRQTYSLLNEIAAAQLTAEIRPRVFEEQFPDKILYVGDVIPGPVVRWKDVFLADISTGERREGSTNEAGDDPRITIAGEIRALPDVARNRIQLALSNASTHEPGRERLQYFSTSFPEMDQMLYAAKRQALRPKEYIAWDTAPLWEEAKRERDAGIELHQRLALPLACTLLALMGLPLGVSSRKGGRSGAFVTTVLIALFYYTGLITLVGLARQGTLAPAIALWIPNGVLLVSGVVLVARMDRPGDRDWIGAIRTALATVYARVRGTLPESVGATSAGSGAAWNLPIGPQILDNYVLGSLLFYFTLLMTSFVVMTQVFTFFELLSDILRHSIPMAQAFKYLFFLTPKLIYDTAPIAVLVAVLVTFGILTKNNEITAMKACGISLYRLAIPTLLISVSLSAFLFVFDYYVVPDANRIQEALRDEIKGRPTQTYFRPDRKWIIGEENRIYYYKHFEPYHRVMIDVNVYELAQNPLRLRRHISAERARWEPALGSWVFQNGWARTFEKSRESGPLNDFTGGTATFAELTEPPSWFLRELKQEKQMNFRELATYIRELQQSGFDTVRLQVQYYKKFAVPLFAVIMALISFPFAFMAANRGAMAGIGVSFGIAIFYWAVSQLFEQVGNVDQLPPVLAAWAPDAVFTLGGLYFLARLRT